MKKILLALILMLSFAVEAHGQGAATGTIFGPNIAIKPGASVLICSHPSVVSACQANKVVVYSDLGLTTPTTNPTVTDGHGQFLVYVPSGTYDYVVFGSGITPQTVPFTFTVGGSGGGGSVSPPGFAVQFANIGVSGSATASCNGSAIGVDSTISPTVLNVPCNLNVTGLGGNVSLQPVAANSIQYVSPQGHDTSNGLSWGTSKLTIFSACEALPGGGASPATCGIGTIYIADGSSASPINGCGIWLMGHLDPNYASPPPCWLRTITGGLNFIGVPTENTSPNPHAGGRATVAGGSGSDTTHPGLWMSFNNQPIQFENLAFQFPGRAIVLGEWSNGQHPGEDMSGVSSARFVNVGGQINQISGNGPSWDIWGGSFWLYFENCGGDGNSVASPTSVQGQAFYFHAAADGNTSGLVFMKDMNTSGGAIEVESGSQVGPGFSVDGLTQEGGYSPAAFWIIGNDTDGQVVLKNIVVSDPTGTLCNGGACGVENDDLLLGPEQVIVTDSAPYKGPMLTLGAGALASRGGISTNSVCAGSTYLSGQEGFSNGCVFADTDAGRRLFGPSGVRFTNLANTASSSWNLPSGVTLTTGESAPDGTSNAGRVTNSGGSENGPYFFATPGGSTIATSVGDWYIFGVWSRYNSGPGWNQVTQASLNFSVCGPNTNGPTLSSSQFLQAGPSDGSWTWEVNAVKILAVTSGSSCSVSMSGRLNASSADTADYYAPVLIHIPAGTLADSEILSFSHSLAPYDGACSVGTICGIGGQTLVESTVLAQGKVCTNAELALSAGWGNTATVTAVAGLGQTCQWTITSNGTGTASSPTITDTLTNPLPSASTVCEMQMVGGTGTSTLINQTTLSATAPIFTFGGTPAGSSTTYFIIRRCGP